MENKFKDTVNSSEEISENAPLSTQKQHQRCIKTTTKIWDNPTVQFLISEMIRLNCPISPSFIKCQPCDQLAHSYFDPDKGVIACENHIGDKGIKIIKSAMVHELVHAYDFCRASNLGTVKAHACTEIRAANLSEECTVDRELARLKVPFIHYKFKGHWKECAKERATQSLQMAKGIPKDEASKVIEEVWDVCIKDTKPFENVPL